MTSSTDRPVLPVRRMYFRLVDGKGFVPCPDGTGTLVKFVDALGRNVSAVRGNPFDGNDEILGWQLSPGQDAGAAAAIVQWLDRDARRRRTKATR